MNKNVFKTAFQEFIFVRTYSRWLDKENRRETWEEAVDRYCTYMKEKHGDKISDKEYKDVHDSILNMEVMPSMRAMWVAGKALDIENFSGYNCLGEDTEFVTDKGVKSFRDFKDGDKIVVLTHKNNWKKAVVKNFGKQKLNKITYGLGGRGLDNIVYATEDHRWFLNDSEEVVTEIKEKDNLLKSCYRKTFDFDSATPEEKTYWCYGFVYGDGTKIKRNGEYKHSLVRLLGDKKIYLNRFEEVGFKTSVSDSIDGGCYAYTGEYLKTLPKIEKEPLGKIEAFVDGLLCADGGRKYVKDNFYFCNIQQSGEEGISFIRKAFPMCGYFIVREDDYTGETTNYGERNKTIRFSFNNPYATEYNSLYTVRKIDVSYKEEDVWCLVVEDDKSFVLKNGLVTGNCAFTTIQNLKDFAEILYILMNGTGVGFSVERKFVNNLPLIQEVNTNEAKEMITFADSKLGWAKGYEKVLNCLWNGIDFECDYSKIRPRGSRLKTFGGRACLTGNTVVYKDRKKSRGCNEITIKDLYDMKVSGKRKHFSESNQPGPSHFNKVKLRSLDEESGVFFRNQLIDVVDNGVAPIFEIVTESGYKIKATSNHRFMKDTGEWCYVSDFSNGDLIAINGSKEKKTGVCIDCGIFVSRRAIRCRSCANKNQQKNDCLPTTVRQRKECQKDKKDFCELCKHNGSVSKLQVHHKDGNPYNNKKENKQTLCEKCHRKEDARRTTFGNPYSHRYLSYDKIVSVDYVGKEQVYDLVMEAPNHNFVANGFVSHNSGPEPLKNLVDFTTDIVEQNRGYRIQPIDAHDICCKIAEIVVVGGTRRSALLSLSDLTDNQMAHAKSGEFWNTAPQRSMSNNSVSYTRKPDMVSFLDEWKNLYKSKSGERGFFNRVATQKKASENDRRDGSKVIGTNPSLRKGTKIITTDGLLNIEDLEGKEFDIINLNGKVSKAKCWLSGKSKKLYRVKFVGGHEYYCTAEHKWPVYEDGEYFKKETTEIFSNDWIAVNKNDALPFGNQGNYYDGFFIGWIYGDGAVGNRSTGERITSLCVSEEAFKMGIGDILLEKLHMITGGKQKWIDRTVDKSTYEMTITNKKLDDYLDSFEVKRKEHGLPKFIFNKASEDFRKGFLDGILSSDGHIEQSTKNSYRLTFISSHKKIAEDISTLFGMYGIKNSIMFKQTTASFPNGRDYDRLYNRYTVRVSDIHSMQHLSSLLSLKNTKNDERLSSVQNIEPRHTINKNNIKVISVEETDLFEDVWDVSVFDDTHCFQLTQCVTGNCGEVLLRDKSLCNLTEVVIKPEDNFDSLKRKIKIATMLGTWQAALTNFKFGSKKWKENCDEEALLGVSLTGARDHKILGTVNDTAKKWIADLKHIAIATNKKIAPKIGINRAAAITCIKPSGCLSVDSLITTNEGILELQEIGDVVGDAWQDHKIYVEQENSAELSTKFHVNGESPTKLIHMSSGVVLESTLNHKFRVMEKGEYVWKEARDIINGDCLPYKIGGYAGGSYQELTKVSPPYCNVKEILQPEKLEEDLAYVLGLYAGDGSTHKKGIRIAGHIDKKESLYKASEIIKRFFNIDCIIYERTSGNNADLYANSTFLLSFLRANDLVKNKTEHVEIPLVIRKSPASVIKAFVDGLFDADGCESSSGYKILCTVSEKLAKQLPVVLRCLGYACSCKLMPPTKSSLGNRMRYRITIVRGRDGEYNKSGLGKYYKMLDDFNMKNFIPDIVEYVEDSHSNTADLEVPNNNTYIANSYVSHNTVSLLVDCSPGAHTRQTSTGYYIRRVRISATDPLCSLLREQGIPALPEVGQSKDNCSTFVLEFPCKAPKGAKTKYGETAKEQLEYWKMYRDFYCEHNPSITISVKEDEWLDTAAWVYKNFDNIGGLTFLPSSDHVYQLAPYEDIDREEYEKRLKDFPKNIDFSVLSKYEKEDATEGAREFACSGDKCELV